MLTHPKTMRKIIILTSIIVVFALFCTALTGCSKEQNNPGLSKDNVTNQPEYKDGDKIPEKKIDKYIWDKEFKTITTSSVTIDEKWDEYIVIDGDYISSKQMVDISELQNYFRYGDEDSAFLKACYEQYDREILIRSVGSNDVEFAQSVLVLTSGLVKQNAYITNVNLQTTINQYEGGLDNLIAKKMTENVFTIGNTYEKVNSVLTNGTKAAEDVQDILTSTTYIYQGKNVKLELQFTKTSDMADKDAVLTGISWTPITIRNAIKDTMYREEEHWHENKFTE